MSERLKNVLIVVTADPCASGRAAEAVRIAAGVGGWEKVAVKLCLCGQARRILSDLPDEFVHGEVFGAYLPVLLEGESKVFTLIEEQEVVVPVVGVTPMGIPQLAAMGRAADSVLRF